MPRLTLRGRAAELLEPLRALVDAALERLPPGPPITVELGETDGFYAVDGTELTLSNGLLGPDMHHPSEPPGEARLDRWRRAASSVLEGAALLALSEVTERPVDLSDWRQVGAAVEVADHVCPDLSLGLADLLAAASSGQPGASPSQGAAVYRALRRQGEDPWARASAWVAADAGPDRETWLRVGAWILGTGLVSEVAVPVETLEPVDIPVELPAWSWARLDVPAHRRGGEVRTGGGAVVQDAFAEGGQRLRTLAGALGEPGSLEPGIGGPVGTWENLSATGFGQVFGVRGITWTLHPDGRLELLLADAFAGPAEALEMAEKMGTSGLAPGRWRVAGDHRIRVSELVTSGLTMHGRQASPFALPAGGGLGDALQAMQEEAWTWRQVGEELYLNGRMFGSAVEMRFRRSP